MVCFDDDLVEWKDFPKGLRVLLLDEDGNSAAETKSKLEAMDYVVSSYFNEKDASDAISRKTESFHVAVVEVTTVNIHESLRFLEMAKDLPTIAISNVDCMSTMMKCITLGAVEFLQKPLSEDKLRNIWQHVVHKAFNAGGNILSKSLEPIKEKVVSMLQVQSDKTEYQIEMPDELLEKSQEIEFKKPKEADNFQAPSTPKLTKGRSLTDGEHSEDTKDLIDVKKNSHCNSKSVDNTSDNFIHEVSSSSKGLMNLKQTEVAAEEEVTSDIGPKTDERSTNKESCKPTLDMHSGDNIQSPVEDQKRKKSSCGRRKMKVDWTPELHKKFVKAVEQLGIDHAIPSKILELMKIEGLTRHNIASHLQKYRMQRKHISQKNDQGRCQAHTNSLGRGYMQKPLIPVLPLHSNYVLPPSLVYPFWRPPSYYATGTCTWGLTGFPAWHPPQGSWLRTIPPAIHADAWGCPVVPPNTEYSIPSQNPTINNGFDAGGGTNWLLKNSYDLNPAEEVIDEVMRDAMSKPWLPLPLGLKPPSIDSVLTELQRQGIPTIPHITNRQT